MQSSIPINNPLLAFNEENLNLPGIGYGEFDLTTLADENAPFKSSLITVEIGASTPVDQHQVRECWYIISGTGKLNYQGKEQNVGPEQMLFFESHHSHFIQNTSNEALKILSLWWPH